MSDDKRYQDKNKMQDNKKRYKKRIDQIETYNLVIDYKKPDTLKKFLTERGKILPRRITGTNAKNQRMLVREIKRARFLGLLPMG